MSPQGDRADVFRWALGLAQAIIVVLITILLNGQGSISTDIASLRSDMSVVNTRVSAIEPVAVAYSGLANRVTALETIMSENSRRIAENGRMREQVEMLLDRRMDQAEKRFEALEKRLREMERK